MSLKNLEPHLVWEQFEAITRVPRPSKKEEKIIEYLINFAIAHGIEYQKDQIGNVVMRKAATAGYEDRPCVILQSHMDMVCEKLPEVDFDFDNDPIQTKIVDGWVMAEGTTLGADCGIGMAAALAILLDKDSEHGPIEALFTVDEETGLTGAFNLGEGMLSGKYLINLDSEDEGEIFIGCAGGVDTVAYFKAEYEPAPVEYDYYKLSISGLMGGHSGDDINKGRANSNKLMARILLEAHEDYNARVSYMDGGNLRNAIPRDAYAIFGVDRPSSQSFKQRFEAWATEVKAEFTLTEPQMQISLCSEPKPERVLKLELQQNLLHALVGVANGVISISHAVEGLVETSTNLASVKFGDNDEIIVTTSQRSSVESAKLYAKKMVESTLLLAGAEVKHSDGYPGWAPNPNSQLLRHSVECYKDLFGTEPKVKAVHAGLECGLFLEKYPDLEMVSFGPTLRGVHSPEERLEIATVDKFWILLKELLKRV
ncbi:MAG: aminoacyl-histidine dipeptidase [Alistipes sp.]|nr:aminoacyl-histidine dipeptidase [Alistipes sp.]